MKKLKLLLMLLVVGVISSGCVKFNANMDIKKDKSMDFTIIYALDKNYFSGEDGISVDEFKEIEKSGFKVESYKDENMEGVKLTKSIRNIDDVSSDEDVEYSLSGIMGEDANQKLFKVKKGLLKNTYTAKFTFNANESGLTDDDEESNFVDDDNLDTDTLGDENEDALFNSDGENNLDLTNMTSNLDLSFNVTLPYKVIKSNATKTEDNNKKLSWTLTATGSDAIEFEFSIYNMNLIYAGLGVILVIIIIVVMVIMMGKKNKKKVNTNVLEESNEKSTTVIDNAEEQKKTLNNDEIE